ncbi:MAG: tyrosine--tRNA ligase [bacterium]
MDKEKKEELVNILLTRGVENIYPSKESLKNRILTGKSMRLYCGYDPSGPTLHLGHLVSLKKLAEFQKLGHHVIMLIGDFTGMIGDPTDKTAARKKLTRDEVIKNATLYKKQATKFLSFSGKNPARIIHNSQWSDKLTFLDLIEITSNFTVQQMITRDMFQKRLKDEKPIYLHEFLYPIAQAYDSVAMDVDLEIGGNDQTFNMLCGRDLTKAVKGKEKYVMSLKLLIDESGKKMGKSEGNFVSLMDNPKEMFGKIMAWPDELIIPGMELLTESPMTEISDAKEKMSEMKINPRDAKANLAKKIITMCYSEKEAEGAEKEFNQVFKNNDLPENIPEIIVGNESVPYTELVVILNLASSKGEAKRLIIQKGVKINGQVNDRWQEEITVNTGMVVQVGKRRFAKIIKK